jgi:hypothetical protein
MTLLDSEKISKFATILAGTITINSINYGIYETMD